MECALDSTFTMSMTCFNPCYNGTLSEVNENCIIAKSFRFNPYSNGKMNTQSQRAGGLAEPPHKGRNYIGKKKDLGKNHVWFSSPQAWEFPSVTHREGL